MTAFHLAPHVGLQYWRDVPRLVAVDRADQAAFAILSVLVDPSRSANGRITARFDLPAHSDTLAVTLAAVNAAYTLGHHDRQNRISNAIGYERMCADHGAPLPEIRRGHDDRD